MNKEQRKKQPPLVDFIKAVLPDQWPSHLLKTFQQIRRFKNFDYATFLTQDPSISGHDLVWRKEILDRTTKVVETAATLIEDEVAEMELRLRLEEKVLRRFELEIDCPSCKKRLWRADVEAEAEFPGDIAENLESRRKSRQPCQCAERLSNLNTVKNSRIFTSRADEMMILFDSQPQEPSSEKLKRRRPDRIIGFQETNSLSRRLDQSDLMASRLRDELGIETLRQTVDSTVLNHKGNCLLFPFLIIEAKSGSGASFNACDEQASLPILQMLKMQERIQAKSQMRLEYGGPLLWYIACRGEDWRLSACFTRVSESSSKSPYVGINLWSGHLNDGDGALQLLLIVDYIFDWARDIYRPSIIAQLELLANPAKDRIDVQDNGSFIADTDSDILSLARPKKKQDIEAWISVVDDPLEAIAEEDLSLMKWATYDSPAGVFRPACLIESIFRCVYATSENIDALFSAIPKRNVKQHCLRAERVLESNTVLISDDTLWRMEEIWTDKARPRPAKNAPRSHLFASITYHTIIDHSWELKRVLSCAVFDEYALSILRKHTKRKTATLTVIRNTRRLRKDNVESLLNDLKNRPIQHTLAAAIAKNRQHLRTVPGALSTSPCPTFQFVDTDRLSCRDFEVDEVVGKVYDWTKTASEEPQSFLRVSQKLNTLASSFVDSTVASYFPKSEPMKEEHFILVVQYDWDHHVGLLTNKPRLCLYMVPGLMSPPTKKHLIRALEEPRENDAIYFATGDYNHWGKSMEKYGDCSVCGNAVGAWRQALEQAIPEKTSAVVSMADDIEVTCLGSPTDSSGKSPSPLPRSPSSCLSVFEVAESHLKRPPEDDDANEGLRLKKRLKTPDNEAVYEVIVIED